MKGRDVYDTVGNNGDIKQFVEVKERNTNYRSLSTHLMNKNKKNALRILNRGE